MVDHIICTGIDSCRVADANIGFANRPGCISRMKNAESSWETNQYNDCGYRTKESCGPKPAGTIRVALVGFLNERRMVRCL